MFICFLHILYHLMLAKVKKVKALKELKEFFLEKDNIQGEKMYFVFLPLERTHAHQLIGTTRRMHTSVRMKIHELVHDGIANVIKKLLKKQVKTMCASDVVMPHSSDRAYFPTTRDIYSCVHALLVAGKYSQLGQIQLEMLVKEWMSRDIEKPLTDRTKFYFRKSSRDSDVKSALVTYAIKRDVGISIIPKENFHGNSLDIDSDEEESREGDDYTNSISEKSCSFLFVHQEPWQQRLLVRYGNIIALLDATYKTTKYSLPLFLLCVQWLYSSRTVYS